MLPFVTNAPPVLEESLAGELDMIVWVLSHVCRAVQHVEVRADLRNICLDDETSWAEVIRVGLHALEERPGLSVR
jgi:hypothetical protein